MHQFFAVIESTGFAQAVGESLSVTAWLSAFHLIGFTLVMSSGLVWSLRATGLLLAEQPRQSIARPAARILVVGLTVSLVTGFALFAPKASYTALNSVFQLKIGLLLFAAINQLAFNAIVVSQPTLSAHWLRASGVLGSVLWLALAITACWFILFE